MATVHSTDPAAKTPQPSTKRRPGPVQTVSNNTSALTLGDLARAELEDQSLEIAIHLGVAKAIADIIHICTGSARDGSESRLDELGVQTLPTLVYAIRRHIEEAESLQRAEVHS